MYNWSKSKNSCMCSSQYYWAAFQLHGSLGDFKVPNLTSMWCITSIVGPIFPLLLLSDAFRTFMNFLTVIIFFLFFQKSVGSN